MREFYYSDHRVYRAHDRYWWYINPQEGGVVQGNLIEMSPLHAGDQPATRLWAILKGWGPYVAD